MEELKKRRKNRKRATIDEVAARAGVSIKTVSRVFNSEPNVRPQTREKVLEAARELDYRPNLSARRLASNRSFVIGLLYENPESDYITAIQEGTLSVCRDHGFHLLIHPSSPDDPGFVDEVIGLYRQSTVDGFILTQPLSEHPQLINALSDNGVHFVRITQRESDLSPMISVNDTQAAHRMTEYLIDMGHRRIAFITGNPAHGSSKDRLDGYLSAMKEHDLEVDNALVEQGLYNFESGYSAARRLLSLAPRPTAVFASNDHMAMGVLTVAHEKKLEVPSELSVCGFDDTRMARYAWPPLTTLRQPIKQIARLATETLLKCINDEDDITQIYQLQSELVRRASTGPCPKED